MTNRKKVYVGISIFIMISIIFGVGICFIIFERDKSNQLPIKIAEEKIVDDCVYERGKFERVRRSK